MVRSSIAAVSLTLLAACAGGDRQAGEGRGHDQPNQAVRFRAQQRLSEDGTLPENALMVAKGQRDAMLESHGAGGVASINWTWLGPGNIGGRIRGILINPSNPSVMYVGSCSGGVWKTTNGGAAWAPLDDFMPSLAIGCMVMDPGNPNVIFAGTGEGFFETVEGTSNTAAVRGAGIFKTTNGGTTWAQLPSTVGADWYFVNRLAISPANTQIMLAATSTGIFRTTNAGTNWTKVANGWVYDLQFHPSDGTKAVAGRHDTTPIYSTDGGQTWQAAAGASGHRVELRYAKGSPDTVYAAVSNAGAIKIYRSTDGGKNYVLRTAGGGVSTYEAYNSVLWVNPTNSDMVVLGGVGLYRSTDGGINLPQAFAGVHADQHVIVEHPGFNGSSNKTIFFGCDGGIYRAADVGVNTVTELNNNLGITQFYGAGINANGVVVGGTQDNGTLRYTGNTELWTSTAGGDGGFCAADPTDPNYFYGEIQYLSIFRSTNGGQSASYIYQGISDTGTLATNFIPFFMLDPNEPNRMLACARRLWRSNNVKAQAPTWAVIKDAIPGPDKKLTARTAHFAENDPRNISTVAVAQGNPDIIWVGHNNGDVYRTANGTAVKPAWTRVDTNGVGLPNRWVSRIVIDRNNHQRVYVSVMGWTDNNLWRTPDNGQTWTDISGSGNSGIPTAPISALAQHPASAKRLYVGTDIGIFTSEDDGATWTTSTQGPGTVPVDELVWKDTQTLMAATHGRGIYLGAIPVPPCYPDCDKNGTLDIDDFICFQTYFSIGHINADCDGNGILDIDDFVCFQTQFGVGCP